MEDFDKDISVSICTQTFNHGGYIRQCLEGFLSQKINFKFEVIINDDASTDDTAVIVKEYEARYPNIIKAIYQKDNQYSKGVNTLTRLLFHKAQGKYIAICEGDDYWCDENKLQKQVDFMEANKESAMCFTNVNVFDDDTKELKPYWTKIETKNYEINDLLKGNVAPNCSVMFRNGLVDFSRHTFEGLPMGDWPLYVFLLRKGYATYLDFVSAVYRVRSASMYSKISVVDQLRSKHRIFEYFMQSEDLLTQRKLIKKVYYENLYALAIRLSKSDKRQNEYLKAIAFQSISSDVTLSFKAIVKLIF